MGKVRLIAGIVVIVLFFVFALFNGGEGHSANIRFFLNDWTVRNVPMWGVIYITLAVGLLVGYSLRGARKHKK